MIEGSAMPEHFLGDFKQAWASFKHHTEGIKTLHWATAKTSSTTDRHVLPSLTASYWGELMVNFCSRVFFHVRNQYWQGSEYPLISNQHLHSNQTWPFSSILIFFIISSLPIPAHQYGKQLWWQKRQADIKAVCLQLFVSKFHTFMDWLV